MKPACTLSGFRFSPGIHYIGELERGGALRRMKASAGGRPLLDRFTADPFLRALLSIQAGDHGMAPSRAPTALHAGLQSYYFDGGCCPKGGGHHIPDTLIRHIEAHGGKVVLGTEVARVLVEDGRTLGVQLADGTEVRAPVVATNTDPGVPAVSA